MHTEQHTELDNLITTQHNLRTSAKGSNDAYDVSVSLTSYEPNDMVFSELGNSQGSFSYITPSSDLDIDDATLGKLLDEAHREDADYRNPEGVSVSQSLLSVVFDRAGKPAGERDVDQSIGFGVTRNTHSACHYFLCFSLLCLSQYFWSNHFIIYRDMVSGSRVTNMPYITDQKYRATITRCIVLIKANRKSM